MRDITRLRIQSKENPDNNGYWRRSDIEDEMLELGFEIEEDNWLEYILDHLEIEEWIYDIIINPNFISGSFRSKEFGDITIKKW